MLTQPSYTSDCALLGVALDCTIEDLKKAFRLKALQTHPDRGGRAEDFRTAKAAYDRLLAIIPKRETLRREQARHVVVVQRSWNSNTTTSATGGFNW